MENPLPTNNLPRVLCVDDEPHIIQGIKNILRRKYAVVSASNAHEIQGTGALASGLN